MRYYGTNAQSLYYHATRKMINSIQSLNQFESALDELGKEALEQLIKNFRPYLQKRAQIYFRILEITRHFPNLFKEEKEIQAAYNSWSHQSSKNLRLKLLELIELGGYIYAEAPSWKVFFLDRKNLSLSQIQFLSLLIKVTYIELSLKVEPGAYTHSSILRYGSAVVGYTYLDSMTCYPRIKKRFISYCSVDKFGNPITNDSGKFKAACLGRDNNDEGKNVSARKKDPLVSSRREKTEVFLPQDRLLVASYTTRIRQENDELRERVAYLTRILKENQIVI